MSASDPDRDASRHWLDLARGDLRAAYVLIADGSLPPRIAVGSAHQAAEKALKALIVFIGSDPPRSHDLVMLAQRVASRLVLVVDEADLRALTDAYAEARYPAHMGVEYDAAESAAFVAMAARIVGQVVRELET